PLPLPIPVAVRLPLRRALIPVGAGRRGHLRLHYLAQHHPHRLAQHVAVLLHQKLARRRPHGHALIVGHRGAPLVSALVRNTDDPTSPRWPTPTTSGLLHHATGLDQRTTRRARHPHTRQASRATPAPPTPPAAARSSAGTPNAAGS